jgi:SAM-dependent methyltransferase
MIRSVPATPAHVLRAPCLDDVPIPGWARSVLDLGCGDGQGTLQAAGVPPPGISRFVCGVDIDMASLRACKARAPHLQCVQARGEQLPFQDGAFDYIMSAVALPYMDLAPTLRETRRVLKPGGEFWASLHRQLFVWDHLLKSLRTLNWKDILYRTYVLVNGFGLHFTGKLFRFPLKRRRIESGQTRRGMRLALQSAGFTDVVMGQGGERFIVTARRT